MSTIKETHRATVKDNDDPERRGRLLVASATLMGVDSNGEAVDFPHYIEPLFPVLYSSNGDKVDGGWFAIPSVGATVEIEVASHSSFDQVPGQTSQTDPDPRWRSCVLRSGDSIPTEFLENYPKRSGLKTASGHTLIFDDSPLGQVSLTHKDGMQIKFEKTGISIGLSSGGPELLSILDQLMDALDAFTVATGAAIIEPTLKGASVALNAKVKLSKTLLSRIKGRR